MANGESQGRNAEKLTVGIITPSRGRRQYVRPVVRQILAQTCPDWLFGYVLDGPNPVTRDLFHQEAGLDERIQCLETSEWANDWGVTPRIHALEWFLSLPQPPDYVVMWDDDNTFYPRALETIVGELARHEFPDFLLVPIHYQRGIKIAPEVTDYRELKGGDIDTANFVVRPALALRAYRATQAMKAGYGEDFATYSHIANDPETHVAIAHCPPIGRYDGQRRLSTLRWKLGIPPLNIMHARWWNPVRRRIRR